ncbi:exo-beta-1,3-glucanase [Pochonia chlamydosporia 170]|uniref:Exo-beta-1,3-glucanase n=1 Tax=Pochonia chlamydosporia 170 TaxID=1380566 RepID=A0A179FQD9_METCM|nr:exo-beta-1,3-glucanase [Pochonia chlamydosporia 170]OAQ67597.1 exo-beta-1,3-glucanase [Pochonia chlamydosporia 170]
MKTTTSATLFGLIAAVAAYPASTNLWPRGCAPGTLVCNGDSKFGICNLDTKAFWMDVAEGTKCVCSGSSCTITASSGSGAKVEPEPTPESTPTPEASPSAKPTKPFENNPVIAPVPSSKAENNYPPPAPTTTTAPVYNPPPTTTEAVPSTPVTTTAPKPTKTSAPSPGGVIGKYIQTFLGNGDASQGWPEQAKWVDFETMWSSNLANVIYKSCEGFGQENNSDEESEALKSAIQSVAKSSGVDERFILAVVMQESNGCVRAPTTNYGVTNPGLMQSHNGGHSCYNVSPCPSTQVVGMIQDGTSGTSDGDGLKQLLSKAGSGVSQFYKAARMYNSGSIAASGLLQDGIATHCYASDIANRLMGWSSGVSGCKL